jgi:cysteine synthase A
MIGIFHGGKMENISDNILCKIGKTPLVRINRLNDGDAEIIAKIESFNPGGSVKDRIAVSMVEDAEKAGTIDKNTVIIEPTSGNTGIGLAMVCAVKGYKLILTMPDTMSIERRNLIKAYGADIELTLGIEGMRGSIAKALELKEKIGNAYIPQQFTNKSNPKIHESTTAVEILEDTGGKVDIFVSAAGTGGTLTGTARILKKKLPGIKIVAVEPEASAVLSGNLPGTNNRIQGIGAGFIPEVLNVKLIDEVIAVSNENAFDMTRKIAQSEGILAGISSGAALYAAVKLSKKAENKGKRIVVIFPDTGERYLGSGVY